jgi:hypothetical protein
MAIKVQFMSLVGPFRCVREEDFSTTREATAAVERHAASANYRQVRFVDCENDGYHVRWTATTPGGRHGRNVALADIDYLT